MTGALAQTCSQGLLGGFGRQYWEDRGFRLHTVRFGVFGAFSALLGGLTPLSSLAQCPECAHTWHSTECFAAAEGVSSGGTSEPRVLSLPTIWLSTTYDRFAFV